MKKVALVFVLAVLVPSLLLAWLAVRSLRDQQFLLERQQSLLDQHVTDALAQNISDYLAQRQQEFSAQVENLAAGTDPQTLATQFDDQLRQHWPLAEVGFCVTAAGKILSPLPNARPAAQMFRLDNSGFLGNREPVEVYLTANNANANGYANSGYNAWNNGALNFTRNQASQSSLALNGAVNNASVQTPQPPSQELKSTEKATVLNSPASSPPDLASAVPSTSTGSGGGGGFGGTEGSGRGTPAPAGSTASPIFADSTQLPVQQRQQLATDTYFKTTPVPASAINANAAQNLQSGRNAFIIDSSTPAAQSAQRQAKLTGRPATRNSRAQSQAFAIDGPVGGAGGVGGFDGGATIFTNAMSPPVTVTVAVVPVPADEILPAPQSQPELAAKKDAPVAASPAAPPAQPTSTLDANVTKSELPSQSPIQNTLNYKSAQARKVSPQSQKYLAAGKSTAEDVADNSDENLSRVVPAEAEFSQSIGDQTDGMLARFLQNKLKLMCWHRLSAEPDLIFGAQLNLDRVVDGLRNLVKADHSWGNEICLAVLDDNARPVVVSRDRFQANWKRPFVATEVGDALPHWEVAAYLANPAQLSQAAQTAKLTLGLLIALLVVAIGIGSLLIVRGLETELRLARQKTDFVSNVSHELKTPLTSIRMFSELLAEGRVADQAKQHSYLQIITAEAGRLTRLINNVLDFSRMERGEKKYNFQPCDLTDIVRSAAETFRPHLESSGFQFACELPAAPIPLRGDSDALSQIIVNLLSNAEKYSVQPERRSPTRLVGDQASVSFEQHLEV